jgi:hypothetical protein
MKIASATSKMTGQSITEAFNDITMGVARQSRMILDNLGIIVNVDDANRKYAKSLGTTADALDDAQKKQAFMNAVLEAGNDMIKRLGSSSGSLDGVNKLIAAQSDLWAEVNKTVATFLDKELSGYASALKVISDLLKGMRGTAEELSKSSAWKEIEMLKSLEAKGLAQPGTAAAKEAAFNEKYLKPQFGLKPSEENKLKGSFTTPAWSSASWREREGNFASNTEEQNKAILKGIEDERKLREKNAEEELKWMDVYHKSVLSEFEFERATLDAKLKEYDKFVSDKLALDAWYNAEKRKIDIKEYADTASTREMGVWEDIREKVKVDEEEFKKWYLNNAKKFNLDLNPDAQEHYYDYRAAYASGANPDKTGHWPSQFKHDEHPNRFIDGVDTKYESMMDSEKRFSQPDYIGEWGVESQRAKSYKASIDAMQKNSEDFQKNNEELWKKSVTYGEETMDQWLELTERTAAAMQDNFSNLFFDAMTGKLKTLEDYAKAVFDAIARMASDMAAQMATEALFGNLSKTGGGGGGGGLLGSIIGMFGGGGGYTGGNSYGAQTGDWGATMHSGGTVGVSGGPVRSIPTHYFSTAPRLHQGLAADEYPAILQKGEQVIPKGGGKSSPIVHMHFYSQNGKYDRDSISQAQSSLYASLNRANRRNT